MNNPAHAKGSLAVIAGAGTGKTYMLSERYLYHLVGHKLTPLEIVAVTFTEKAATELRSRIRKKVSENLSERDDILAELEAAQICTIHSLAARICHEHPEAADVSPDFSILDDLKRSLWLSEHLDDALGKLPLLIFEKLSYTQLQVLLPILLADPLTAESAFQKSPEHWPQLAATWQQKSQQEFLENPCWQQYTTTVLTFQGNDDDKMEQARQVALKALRVLKEEKNPREAVQRLKEIKLQGGSSKKWPNGGLEEVKSALKEMREIAQKASNVGLITLETGTADEQLALLLPHLYEAFQSVKEHMTCAKRRARVLDFVDLEECALRALQHPEVHAYYAQRWKAFLIDEFQDTNPVQAELLRYLTQGAICTIVGDEKQSIYGFRRADVQVFKDFREGILATGGEEYVLKTSYRTHAPLIQLCNQVFSPLLMDLHQEVGAFRKQSPHPAPHIRAYRVEAPSGTSVSQCRRVEAYHLASVLKQMLDDKVLVHDEHSDGLREINPGDIAILARAWEPLELYGDALAAAGIPSVHAGGGSLLATREAKDAWALLRFLVNPKDNLALAAVLRSPFFAVSDQVLFHLVSLIGKESPWWGHLERSSELNRPVQVLDELLQARQTNPPSRLLQMADRLCGYTAVMANLPGRQRREADWRGFLDLIRELEKNSEDLFIVTRCLFRYFESKVEVPRPPLEAKDAVSLMSIHASKGLEWPVVVVPDLARQDLNTSFPIYFDTKLGVAIKTEDAFGEAEKPILYTVLEQQQELREQAEARRVLYVALTRARDQILLSATKMGGNLNLLLPGLDAAEVALEPILFDANHTLPPVLPETKPLPEPLHLLPGSLGSGLCELPVTALSDYARCPRRFQFRYLEGHPGLGQGAAVAQRVGTLTHLALEQGIQEASLLSRYDLTLPQENVEEAIAMALSFYENPVFQSVRQAIEAKEETVTFKIGCLTLNGVADLVGSDFVLDFKTGKLMDPQHHRLQLWVYAQAKKKSTAHIAYLRDGSLYTFSTEELQAAAHEAQIIVDNILADHYPAKPSEQNCTLCLYQEVCRERHPT